MRKTWTDTDAQRLKALREQAGADQAAFAKRHALSTGQVRELEGGKPGSFYSDDIKAHVGRKLLAALGYVAPLEPEPEPEAEPSQAPAPQAAPAVSPEALQASATPEVTQAPVHEPEPEPESIPESGVSADPDPAHQAVTPGAAANEPAEADPPRRSLGPMAILAVIAGIGVALVFVIGERPATAVSTVTVDVAAAPAFATASAPELAASSAAAVASPAASAAASTPAKAASAASAAKLPAGCEPASGREPTQYASPVADKPATYVYVEAIQEARACVLDSRNQARMVVLKAGESINFAGVAPFTIRSAQWNDLKVFFQGLRVQLEPGAASDTVVINPRRPG